VDRLSDATHEVGTDDEEAWAPLRVADVLGGFGVALLVRDAA
jgi:hypothetical protein